MNPVYQCVDLTLTIFSTGLQICIYVSWKCAEIYAETLSVKITRTLLSVKTTLSIVIVCYTVSQKRDIYLIYVKKLTNINL